MDRYRLATYRVIGPVRVRAIAGYTNIVEFNYPRYYGALGIRPIRVYTLFGPEKSG